MERKMSKRSLAILLGLCLIAGISPAHAGDAETIAAVNKASATLDAAFESRNAEAIKAMMTPDHEAVTPYYDGPQSVAAQIESLPDLKYEQTIVGETRVELLGADAAMRTFEARLDGTYKGKIIPPRAFVTSIMVKEDGTWREKFYQVTAMTP
jgi:ketosteroid isomerase-like protein